MSIRRLFRALAFLLFSLFLTTEAFTLRSHPTTVTAGQFEIIQWSASLDDPATIQLAEVIGGGLPLGFLGAPIGNRTTTGALPVLFVNAHKPVTIVGYDLDKTPSSRLVSPNGKKPTPFYIDSDPITVIPTSTAVTTTTIATSSKSTNVEPVATPTSQVLTSTSTTSSTTPSPRKSNTAQIAGGVIGCMAGLAIAACSVFWLIRSRKNRLRKSLDLTRFFDATPSSESSSAAASSTVNMMDVKNQKLQILGPQKRIISISMPTLSMDPRQMEARE
ncbi:hypothetical protein L218DRAFT_1076611 [Marasmius fiardii PR-910]|nr:hypothetical protein L218DRAFT_1076611 [Marasmius fiardii PR-910]